MKKVRNFTKIKEQVLFHYPEAKCLSVPTVNGKSYNEVWSGTTCLGKGKSSQNAWSAACKNMND